jgi:glycosyltransferase involved in cell wall biosynthesis
MQLPGVLHVVVSLSAGGTERLVIEIVRRTHAVAPTAVCCLDAAGDWADEVTAMGVAVTTLGRQPGFHPGLGRAIAALAAQTGATILHCHQYSPFVYGRVAQLVRRELRLVYTEHGRLSDAPPSWKRRLVNPLLGRFRGPILAVSQDLASYMEASGFPRRRVGVIYNGIEPGEPPDGAARTSARQMLGLDADALVVGTVARLDPVKDLGTLVTGFASLAREDTSAALVIVGDGPQRPVVEQAAVSLGIESRLRMTGARRDARALLPAFDVFVNTSTSEGVSLTILEAMAAALPVVATRVGGTPEVVVDGETGLLVPARSPESLARALAQLACAPARRAQFGRAGRRRLDDQFTLERMVSEYVHKYRAVGR